LFWKVSEDQVFLFRSIVYCILFLLFSYHSVHGFLGFRVCVCVYIHIFLIFINLQEVYIEVYQVFIYLYFCKDIICFNICLIFSSIGFVTKRNDLLLLIRFVF
jgi:hypothetical protein